jgi:uncharacterized protein (TIGR02270 family)
MKRELRADHSDTGFLIGIYLEHLQEASALWEQRLQLLDDPEMGWPSLDDFEKRLEAHIDGLVAGGDLALDVCLQQSEAGDPGEFFAAVCVVCRQRRLDLLRTLLESMDPGDVDRAVAAAGALVVESPAEWNDVFCRMVTVKHPAFQHIAARVIGYRRIPANRELLQALAACDDSARKWIIVACGRLGVADAGPALWSHVESQKDAAVAAEAAFALLRQGDARVIEACLRAQDRTPLLAAVGVGGGWNEERALIELCRSGLGGAEVCIALGMLGEASAVEVLIDALAGPHAADAALGLHLITGAPLFGEQAAEPPADEATEDDEAPDDSGAGAAQASAAPIPSVITTDAEVWRAWWSSWSGQFQPLQRYRLGVLRSPRSIVASLHAERLPRRIRNLILHELALHYNQHAWFEADAPVAHQFYALNALNEWSHTAPSAAPGGWGRGAAHAAT